VTKELFSIKIERRIGKVRITVKSGPLGELMGGLDSGEYTGEYFSLSQDVRLAICQAISNLRDGYSLGREGEFQFPFLRATTLADGISFEAPGLYSAQFLDSYKSACLEKVKAIFQTYLKNYVSEGILTSDSEVVS
jgi:hypothetical protein